MILTASLKRRSFKVCWISSATSEACRLESNNITHRYNRIKTAQSNVLEYKHKQEEVDETNASIISEEDDERTVLEQVLQELGEAKMLIRDLQEHNKLLHDQTGGHS